MLLSSVGLCLIAGSCSEPQNSVTVNLGSLLPVQIDTWQLDGSIATYDRETIFDYIDGAGEVYNSYAFREVAVAQYSRDGQAEVTVELFDMGRPDDAFGVFSYACEQEETGIGGGYETRGRVLCFWQNRYYVCVALEQSSVRSDSLLKTVALNVSAKLPPESQKPSLVGLLPTDGLMPFSVRFFHRHQSLNYHYYLARENILRLDSSTNAVLAGYRPGPAYLLVIEYPDDEAASAALELFQQSYLGKAASDSAVEIKPGKYASVALLSRYLIVVLDAVSAQGADSLLAATGTKLAHMK